jgi:hypothetical protein
MPFFSLCYKPGFLATTQHLPSSHQYFSDSHFYSPHAHLLLLISCFPGTERVREDIANISSMRLGLALNAAKFAGVTPETEALFEESLEYMTNTRAEEHGVQNLALIFNAYGIFVTKSPQFKAALANRPHRMDNVLLSLALAQPPQEYKTWHSISCIVSGAVRLGWPHQQMHKLLSYMSLVSEHCATDKGSPQSAALIIQACASASFIDKPFLQRVSVSPATFPVPT